MSIQKDTWPLGRSTAFPFVLNEADITTDIILLSGAPPSVFRFLVETPAGDLIDPTLAGANPTVAFLQGQKASYYRVAIPAAVGISGAGPGTWQVLLSLDPVGYKRYLSTLDREQATLQNIQLHGVRYSVSVHTLSSLRMQGRVAQSSNEPGATLTIRSVLTEYGLPVEQRAMVNMDVERPDHTHIPLLATEIEPGVFEAKMTATLSGVYPIHLKATGATLRGKPFTREQLLTGAIWRGGDDPSPSGSTDPRTRDEQVCRLIECLFGSRYSERLFAKLGPDAEELAKCLREFCHERSGSAGERLDSSLGPHTKKQKFPSSPKHLDRTERSDRQSRAQRKREG